MPKELKEKDFIQDQYNKNPFPAWIWLIVVLCVGTIGWGGSSWYFEFMSREGVKNPFLQVTNREFSVFLWQFPELMRVNAKSKGNYLPGFQYENKVSLVLNESEKYVMVPPENLFLYHTWARLIRDEFFYRSIPVAEFKEFLDYALEWQPQNWVQASKSYSSLIESLTQRKATDDLSFLNDTELPLNVRQAFQGWKNYFKDGEAINKMKPQVHQMQEFLNAAPHYKRNFWRNIVLENYPHYLLNDINGSEKQFLNNDEVAPFLRVAFYNYVQSKQEKSK